MTSTMRYALVALTLGLFMSAATVAQPGGWGAGPQMGTGEGYYGPPHRGRWMDPSMDPARMAAVKLERIAFRLNLSEDQKLEVGAILEEAQAERLAQRAATRERIAEVLTPEQRAMFEQRPGPGRAGRWGPTQ